MDDPKSIEVGKKGVLQKEEVLALDKAIQNETVSEFFSDSSRDDLFPSLQEDERKVQALKEGNLTMIKRRNENEGIYMYLLVPPELRDSVSIPPSEVEGCFYVSISSMDRKMEHSEDDSALGTEGK